MNEASRRDGETRRRSGFGFPVSGWVSRRDAGAQRVFDWGGAL
jgi:hypothetical protein